VVASPLEAAAIKQQFGAALLIVTPGVRPVEAPLGDQHRTLTPQQALNNGADYLVMGRPITKSADPLAALLAINRNIGTQQV
jgi:orotidine-5'-phosphate decarboxylase